MSYSHVLGSLFTNLNPKRSDMIIKAIIKAWPSNGYEHVTVNNYYKSMV